MYQIRIQGLANVNVPVSRNRVFLESRNCGESFIEYMNESLSSIREVLSEEQSSFRVIGNSLYSVVEFVSSRELSEEELSQLGSYVQGQWSDGIGENFEQSPCGEINGREVYISMWVSGQQLEISQESI